MKPDNLAYEVPDNECEAPVVPEGFIIDTPGKADWAIRKIKLEQAQRDQFVDAAREEIGRLEGKIRDADVRLTARTENLCGMLRAWFDTAVKRELRASFAVDLPSGKLVMTKPKLDFERNAEVLTEFVRNSVPEFLKISYTVDWAELKRHLDVSDGVVTVDTTGEVPDGITAVMRPAEFKIK